MTAARTKEFNPSTSNSHDIEKIISAPLVAASHANSMMQREQTTFMMDVGFNENNGKYEPVMIEMVLNQPVMEGNDPATGKPIIKNIESTFKIPLLTIIPINSLAVDKVKVKFEMEINDQIEREQDHGKTSTYNFGAPAKKTQLKGKVSYDSRENQDNKSSSKRQNSSSLKVDVQASTLPLPVGVNIMLEMFQKAIHPVELDKNQSTNSKS